jgi:hypothetical protein
MKNIMLSVFCLSFSFAQSKEVDFSAYKIGFKSKKPVKYVLLMVLQEMLKRKLK